MQVCAVISIYIINCIKITKMHRRHRSPVNSPSPLYDGRLFAPSVGALNRYSTSLLLKHTEAFTQQNHSFSTSQTQWTFGSSGRYTACSSHKYGVMSLLRGERIGRNKTRRKNFGLLSNDMKNTLNIKMTQKNQKVTKKVCFQTVDKI